jgi:hypothetical protein
MRLFNKSTSLFFVICGLPLLFLPKINLLSFGDRETAGIRFDDIVLFFICILFFWAHFSLQKSMNKIERLVFIIISFSLLSFGLNRLFVAENWLHVNASIFYCLRLAEYFIFFYLGAMSVSFFRTSPIISVFFIWNLILMALQWAGLIGQFTSMGYLGSTQGRVVGIASFPSEAGMLIDLLFCYLIFDESINRPSFKTLPAELRSFFEKTYVYWFFLICCTLVIITGSRIAILALIMAFFFRIIDEIRNKSFVAWFYGFVFVALGMLLTITLIQNTDSVFARSEGLFSFKNLKLIEVVWNKIDLTYDPIGNEVVKFDAYDMSWWLRVHKWIYAFKIYWLHPLCWLQGVGPGFAMTALDGGWLRILTENGIIGLILSIKLYLSIARLSHQLRWMIISFGINMIFFDVYLAYKPMSLLFFVSGCAWAKALNKASMPEIIYGKSKHVHEISFSRNQLTF